ncbi:MAG: Asp-tRNA(Asn)/Glu-tRNA(Gln) amidotransferase subunit GatB [Polaromonas sp.]|nr:Asp-tRNA(Asn)/Glu-tRNA(Gln) amidotransferase subunit GatB [Polaromonas sp.]
MTANLLVNGYEVVIGLETHTQLTTQSKIFSRASTAFGAEPNTQASAVDFALPGALPVMNKGAVQRAIEFGLAVNAHIAESSVFARKNYFYPDLPKGYQISQFEIPVVQGGSVEFFLEGEKKSVRLVRAHLEEDAGKSLHEDFIGMSGIDLNRAGTPLLEIVTEPDMRSSAEAVAYAKELHKIVTWIGICDGNMQEGSFRCDANVSVRKPGEPLGTRREIKNLNSFKFMQQAMDYEIRWQIGQIEDGHTIQQATVLFDPDTGETRAMRTKEDAADYRYFPDPDLPPLVISREWVEQVRSEMTELPRVMAARFVRNYGLPEYDAGQLTQSKATAAYFENAVAAGAAPKLASNWITGEIARRLKNQDSDITASPVSADHLAWMLKPLSEGLFDNSVAKKLFDSLWKGINTGYAAITLPAPTMNGGSFDTTTSVIEVIRSLGLEQMSDTGELEKIIADVLAANAKNVEEVRAGNTKAFNALVGQAMKATQGKANPAQVNALLKKKLG